jgi:dihydroorotate dehydrogenase
MMAGAQTIGLGTTVIQNGTKIFNKTNKEIMDWMKKNNFKSVKELIGIAHE